MVSEDEYNQGQMGMDQGGGGGGSLGGLGGIVDEATQAVGGLEQGLEQGLGGGSNEGGGGYGEAPQQGQNLMGNVGRTTQGLGKRANKTLKSVKQDVDGLSKTIAELARTELQSIKRLEKEIATLQKGVEGIEEQVTRQGEKLLEKQESLIEKVLKKQETEFNRILSKLEKSNRTVKKAVGTKSRGRSKSRRSS